MWSTASEPGLRLTVHTTSCRNVISIEYMASTIIVFFYCNYEFQHTKLCSFQNLILRLRVILKILLIFFSNLTPDVFIESILKSKECGWRTNLQREGFQFNAFFFCLAPLYSPPHWRSQSSGYEYLWVDVNLSAVDKIIAFNNYYHLGTGKVQ